MSPAKETGVLRSEVRPYGLRKLFQTEFERARVSQNWIKRMMCHNVPDVESAYSQAELDDMREAYRSTISQGFLRVFPQAQTQFTEEQKKAMRAFLSVMKQSSPHEYNRMLRTETLASGPDSLARVVFRELESKKII